MKKVLNFLVIIAVLFLLPACQTSQKNDVQLTYDDEEIQINVGETINIKPNIIGDISEFDYKLNYELSDDIATVDEEGNLTAIKSGYLDVVITINLYPNAVAQLFIEIIDVQNGKYSITFDVNGGDPLEKTTIYFEQSNTVKLPIPTREGYIFLGWYQGDLEVTNIFNKNYNLVAKWNSLDSIVKVSYNLPNGVYLSNYKTRQEMIEDLIKDLQTAKDQTYTYEYLNEHEELGYTFFAAAKGARTLFSNEQFKLKWGWILEYIKEKRIENGLDVKVYDSFIENGYTNGGAATINLEMIAFICGKKISYNKNDQKYDTTDYNLQKNSNGFWKTYNDYLLKLDTFEKDDNILSCVSKAIKIGFEFDGWYLSEDLNENSKIKESSKFDGNVTLYPKFKEKSETTKVLFNYNGGVNEKLYSNYGELLSTLQLSIFNNESNSNENIIISSKEYDPKIINSNRVYVSLNEYTNLYKIVSIKRSGQTNEWPQNAQYVITISDSYNGTYDDSFDLKKLSLGNIVLFNKKFEDISNTSLCEMKIYDNVLSNVSLIENIDNNFDMDVPIKLGYSFEGWYDDYNNKYDEIESISNFESITLYAIWKFNGKIVGSYETQSWVVKDNILQLLTTYIGDQTGELVWVSKNPEIATVDQTGSVKGISEGLATIVVSDSKYPEINFEFYVTVFDEKPTGMLELLANSNNASVYKRNELIIGIITEPGYFYADIVGSVSKLLFEEYVVHDDYYLSNPSNKSTLNGDGKNGIDFVTFHYAADMQANPTNGGSNLASWNKGNNTNGVQASWHYGTGNDGVWLCQNESYGAWHAGASKRMTWHDTGIKYQDGDPEFAKITLGKDNYFYLNGQKTNVANTSKGTKLNNMGLAFKVVNGNYYVGGHYYNESYRLISSTGGNNNSIGIESSCAEGSDLWLTWQYSAQLCANLLLKYELPIQRLVGHHFFSGKWCPQPMLEYDMEIWWEFIELVKKEMELFSTYSDYELTFLSDSKYLDDNGRIISQPTYSECVTYDVTYTIGNEVKTVTLSSIVPGLEG